jgi:sugar O-acyltransferase (sialic acid O-acetyltransferase NeuD family)
MKNLVIIGAGTFGREVLAWALDAMRHQTDWKVLGFLDANPSALQPFGWDYPILGDPQAYAPSREDVLVCAIGDSRTRLKVALALKERGGEFANLVHPTAILGPQCRIGDGCILCPGTVLTTNVTLGEFVILNVQATVGHDAVVGRASTISAHCDITGRARLGEGVFMGSHACVLPGVSIGDYSVIGAGSVVIRNTEPHTTVMGVPARKVYGPPVVGERTD